MNFKNKNILITGGHGFLGRHLCLNFKANGYKRIFTPNHKEYDLTRDSHVRRMISSIKPYVIIHCAALVGGIGANQEKPGSFFYNNAIMGIGLMEESRKSGVNKFVCIGTVCGYPKRTPVPFKEEYFWNGYPEETNAPYGLAKKMLLVQSQAYRAQYGFNSIYLIPVNMYGPRDNFDLHSSHVIPALIRKFYEAKKMNKKNVAIWGNGSASREFLYVEDCAEAIRLATEKYNGPLPVNIGTGKEITIKKLVYIIKELMKFDGNIIWNNKMPNGQPRRSLDTSKARKEFGFKAGVALMDGLRRTIDWYLLKSGL